MENPPSLEEPLIPPAQPAAARRKNLAHGVSNGKKQPTTQAPEGGDRTEGCAICFDNRLGILQTERETARLAAVTHARVLPTATQPEPLTPP
jgi:hypothetical protein